MPTRPLPTREEQIALMINAPARMEAAARAWLADPEAKASLHKYDRPDAMRDRLPQRANGR